MPRLIAVGVDGSEQSFAALDWAVEAAAARHARVVAIVARPPTARGRDSAPVVDHRNRDIDATVARVRQDVELRTRGTAVVIEERHGRPAEVMLAVTAYADLLVIGGQRYGSWRGTRGTSVGDQLAGSTRIPLCVIHDRQVPAHGRILVSQNGSGGDAAVRFAADEARLRGMSLQVLSTWHYPRDTRATSADTAGMLEQGANAAAAMLVEQVRRSQPSVPVESVVRLGQPVTELAAMAASADLVVVGTPGRRGGFGALLARSSPASVLRRVRAPLIVVPE